MMVVELELRLVPIVVVELKSTKKKVVRVIGIELGFQFDTGP
jgi:hypothetical protein